MISRYFKYNTKELTYLKSKDKKLAAAIDEIGMLERPIIPDLFSALVHSVIGQQISTKAHQTIWQRLEDKLEHINPKAIMALSDEKLQSIGVSFKKVGYIKNIAQWIPRF